MTEWNFWFLAWSMWYCYNPKNRPEWFIWAGMQVFCIYNMWNLA